MGINDLFSYLCSQTMTKAMKEPYLEPSVTVFSVVAGGSILTTSNEGYEITPFNPGFAPYGDPIDFSIF